MEDKVYKMGIYINKKLIYETDVHACSIDQAREFAFENFEFYAYAEEIQEEQNDKIYDEL